MDSLAEQIQQLNSTLMTFAEKSSKVEEEEREQEEEAEEETADPVNNLQQELHDLLPSLRLYVHG